MALAARARSPRGFIIAGLVPAALMLLIGLSGKVTAATLVPGIGPSADWNADWHSVIVRSFWAQADLFSFGMVVAVLHVQAGRGRLRLPRNWRTLALAVAVPVGVVAAVRLTPHDAQLSYRPESTVIAAVFAVLLAFVVLPNRDGATSRLTANLEARPGVAIGLVSYSVFLWHEPLEHWLRIHGLTVAGPVGLGVNIVVLAAVTGLLSALTYRFVEVPALRHKAPVRRPSEPRAHQPASPAREIPVVQGQEARK